MKKTFLIVLLLLLAGTFPAWADGEQKQAHWADQSVLILLSHGFPDKDVPANLDSVITDDQWEQMVFEVVVTDLKQKHQDFQYWIKTYTHLSKGNTQREWAVGGLVKLLNMAGKAPGSWSAGEDYLQNFSDVSEISEPNLALWHGAGKIGLITGYPDGTLRPQKDLTFAEGAALLAKAHRLLYENQENTKGL